MSLRPVPEAHLVPLERLKREARREVVEERVRVDVLRELEHALRATVEGEVRFDAGSRAMYAVDASNYRQVPTCVVVPRSRADVIATVAACRPFEVPVVSRAGGTALAGQSVNTGVVIDFSKYMRHILEVDPFARHAVVEPGVVCDQLNEAVASHELVFGPRPATHSRCGFGGMLGNNSCGSYAQMAGKAVDNTEEMEVLLYDGTVMNVGRMTDRDLEEAIHRGGRQAEVYRRIKVLRARWGDTVRARFPKLPRRVSGYGLDQLLPGPDGSFNVARALVGSESTLVTILNAKVRLVWSHPQRVLVVLGYEDIYRAAEHVMEILPFEPIALEGFDQVLHHNMEIKRGRATRYMEKLLPRGCGWLFVEFGYAAKSEARAQAERMIEHLRSKGHGPVDVAVVDDEAQRHKLWKVREGALGAESFVPGEPDTWPGWEDSAVRPELLGSYLRDLRGLFDRYGYHAALYGHFGMGCVHCTIPFDLYTKRGVATYRSFVEDAAHLVASYGGSNSGEHGDGQSRGELLPIMYGQELMEAFREFKSIWDPDWKMNPGKVIDARPLDTDLRLGGDYHPWEPATHFKYPEDHGSFAHATMRCIGIGACRRTSADSWEDGDVMCPSYMVTREERHTTRGRAHLLHEMLVRGPIAGGWHDENVKEALDLCLACKGCKGDCPVNVDVATHKAEFLAHYYEGRMRPRSAYAFGLVDVWARVASLVPGLVNLATQTPGLSAIAKLVAGMPRERRIPAFAPQTFREWFARRSPVNAGNASVVLWADTFNNYFHTGVAKAAVRVLENAGLHVIVPEQHLCCGRPLYDYGFLPAAKRYLERVLRAMAPHIEARTPVVVLEPSCASVFRDELRGLFPEREDAALFRDQVKLLGELLTSPDLRYAPPKLQRKALAQGHCHHKSLFGYDDENTLLDKMGLDFEVLASGCCGMAGSFGFERGEKYRVSMAAGERVLLPAVRAADASTIVVADGFSCKTQIEQATHRSALHVVEVIAMALDGPLPASFPERELAAEQARAVRRSMRRAAALMGFALLALGALACGLRTSRSCKRHIGSRLLCRP